MNSVDLAFTSALEQARLIQTGDVSPLELTELYLTRIERLNPQLGSFFTVMAEQAIADAQAKTEQMAERTSTSEALPLLFGVPVSIKDLTAVAGVPCSYGVKFLRERVAPEDAGIVKKIREAGCIVLGKTATPELGAAPYTESPGFPPARNPWNLDYTAGGSSGGSAAAVAAGLGAIAHGGDGGGSIRGPAACCGVVGIKPSRGRVTNAPIGDKISGLGTDGPIARTVADAAALLDVMSGYVPGDPYWLPDPEISFLEATRQPSKSLKPLNIAYTTTLTPVGKAHPACEAAILETVKLLEDMGHRVEPIALDLTDIVEPFTIVWQAAADMGVPPFLLGKLTRWLWWRSKLRSGGRYLRAVMQMQAVARRLVVQLDPVDVLVLPVFMHPTIRVREWARLPCSQIFENIVRWVAPCPAFNATGQPAIAIPAGFAENGLPLSVQLVGRPADEITLLRVAAALEQSRPWSHYRPAIAVDG